MVTVMPSKPGSPKRWNTDSGLAGEVIARADKDIIFAMTFLGESQHLVHRHFQSFIEAELEKQGINRNDHALLQAFIDTHAVELREFVFTGVSLSRQVRLGEFEELIGDHTNVFRTDIWDALSRYIQAAEENFHAQAIDLPQQLARHRSESPGAART